MGTLSREGERRGLANKIAWLIVMAIGYNPVGVEHLNCSAHKWATLIVPKSDCKLIVVSDIKSL